MKSLRFGLIGAAAYVAPRHFRAILETGNDLIAAFDPHDNVGQLDSYFPNCQYFNLFERFDRHITKAIRRGEGPDWISVCSPNFVHDSHCLTGLRMGANVICEKPLVLTPANLEELQKAEEEAGKHIYTVLQLRYHPAIVELKARLDAGIKHKVELNYITPRGPWYAHSWKGDESRSGGLVFNIGIHFLDALIWIFGQPIASQVKHRDERRASGVFLLGRTTVKWNLSIAREDLPAKAKAPSFRKITVDGEEIEFSKGFTDLHTVTYRETLAGRGATIADARSAIMLAHSIRTAVAK
jgi:UDP-N-acetyl-2-amino-2-deoxyglucuronate dehydrogenase